MQLSVSYRKWSDSEVECPAEGVVEFEPVDQFENEEHLSQDSVDDECIGYVQVEGLRRVLLSTCLVHNNHMIVV